MSPASKERVQFAEEFGKPQSRRHAPTQKYNRKEIQKRLEIESWMDKQLEKLFGREVYAMRCFSGSSSK